MSIETLKIDFGSTGNQPKDTFYCKIEEQGYIEYSSAKAFETLLRPFVEENGLSEADLVIEGGIGTGGMMPHTAKYLFPKALYIGTDISEAYVDRFGRTRKEIKPEELDRLRKANGEEFDLLEARLAANCLDAELVSDIVKKSGSTRPVLVSMNALAALFGRKATPWERKSESDMIGYEDFLATTPY
jgi:hypothetical protein